MLAGFPGVRILSPTPLFLFCILIALFALPAATHAQSNNASISGTIKDPAGAVVPAAELTLTNIATQTQAKFVSDAEGEFTFRNLTPGAYELSVVKPGFQEYVQRGIELSLNSSSRVDVALSVGAQSERVEVIGNASPLNFENATREEGIAPATLQKLPLLVSGGPRSAAGFAVLMPGVTTGGSNSAFDARINGGMSMGDEATLDGVSMQQGFMSQSGMVSIYQDFPLSPDMVSEVKVLTSGYEPQYGSTTSGQVMATTRSGTNEFNFKGYEYHRNTVLNARPWGSVTRPRNLQHNFGANVGGPVYLPRFGEGGPYLYNGKNKTHFYVNFEAFRQVGGVNSSPISIPSARQRIGDFTDWRDPSGNLIPIYDPATTRTNPAFDPGKPEGPTNLPFLRDQFRGCDGNTPNVICPSRIQNSLANAWFKYLPTPTFGGPLNNFLPPPVPDSILTNSNYWLVRLDHRVGTSDHVYLSFYHQSASPKYNTSLPRPIEDRTFSFPQDSNVHRLNWDHTFSSTLLHHFAFGFLNRTEGYGSINADFVGDFPRIPGVAGYNVPPAIRLEDFTGYGSNAGINTGNITTRPTYDANNMFTWVKGNHTLKFGGEYRSIGGNIHGNGNEAGTFNFSRATTGLRGITSGNAVASFLLGTVGSAGVTFRDSNSSYPRQRAYILHAGDTWKVTQNLTLNYGLRWDMFTPSREKFNRFSFFDPIGPNPGAGGRPGRLAFAGDGYGAASYGEEYPEKLWKKGFAPRVGLAYAISPRTVVRAGYGIFFTQAFYPGWGGGISQDGFNNDVSFSGELGGYQPAFLLQQGIPQNFQRPPFIRSDYRNGQGILYRPIDANERPYAQQWNLTLEHEFGNGMAVSAAYVANKGTRLPSSIAPINVLDPKLLSIYGSKLNDEFQPGQTSLNGVPIPYAGWREQMTGCQPSLAQALLPYPQYCGNLQGLNENIGNSIYHSAQFKAEKRFSQGIFLLGSYTISKLLTSASDNTQRDSLTWSGAQGVISPFERQRNKALATDDVPQVFSLAFVYELPVGRGRRFLGNSSVANAVLGGWQLSSIFRASSGLPFFFRSGTCNVPGQFRAGCIPGMTDEAGALAQDKDNFDPGKGPLFNLSAFEPVSRFETFGYFGSGSRITNLRGFGFRNHDISFIKDTRFGERLNLQLRFETFNVWNWHIFSGSGSFGNSAFTTNIADPNFGRWNGAVSNPRNIQLGVRVEY
ncbi:MAG: TonB-dependent receptor [Acidobacteriota bacterium]|nr:TonB-dependent receptor [Acidobacteriota bacterium]